MECRRSDRAGGGCEGDTRKTRTEVEAKSTAIFGTTFLDNGSCQGVESGARLLLLMMMVR